MKTIIFDKDLDGFIDQVHRNCDISDARGAGLYSICGLALRLRDLYKWEKGLSPWEENASSQVLDWIDKKEQLWETIAEDDVKPLSLFGKQYDPFDTDAINTALSPSRLFYGAGYAHSLKPTFFLARIKKTKRINNILIHILDRELARDLLTIPALNQDNSVILRKDAARLFLWDQMAYLKKSGRSALHFSLEHCGLPDHMPETMKTHFETILSVQEETYVYHEIGELEDTVFDHDIWREIISQFPHTPVELLARTVKDLLADTGPSGTLQQIIKNKNAAGLGFYAAFIDGLARPLFPELRSAFESFLSDSLWGQIEAARLKGFSTARHYAEEMMVTFQKGKEKDRMQWVEDKINKNLIHPLIS